LSGISCGILLKTVGDVVRNVTRANIVFKIFSSEACSLINLRNRTTKLISKLFVLSIDRINLIRLRKKIPR
jgi:hypothetical protein